eukprot:213554-Lingulodinium_polyedra.AAC.1
MPNHGGAHNRGRTTNDGAIAAAREKLSGRLSGVGRGRGRRCNRNRNRNQRVIRPTTPHNKREWWRSAI